MAEVKGRLRPGADYFGSTQQTPSWFDAKVIYVKVAGCPLDEIPELLGVRFPSRSIETALEVNGGRISPSGVPSLTLRRDRVNNETVEVTYVSTDRLRLMGSVTFEVYDRDEVLVCGTIEKSSDQQRTFDYDSESKILNHSWIMECSCVVGQSGCAFFRGRFTDQAAAGAAAGGGGTAGGAAGGAGAAAAGGAVAAAGGGGAAGGGAGTAAAAAAGGGAGTAAAAAAGGAAAAFIAPTTEICVVGHYHGSPLILTQSVQLARRRTPRSTTLDAILEDDENSSSSSNNNSSNPILMRRSMAQEEECEGNKMMMMSEGMSYIESEDGEMTWFNAGVRVGVGIGLGMCLGIGIGVGLLIRTYQATTRTFRRRLF